jgi:predicted phage tail protein
MRTIYLYGELATKFTDRIDLVVDSIPETISALRANFKGFEQFLLEYKPGFFIRTGNIDRDVNSISLPLRDSDDIHIVPAIAGSGKAGLIIVGALLLFVPGVQVVAGGLLEGVLGSSLAASVVTNIGMALLMSGISALLFPVPKSKGPSEAANNTPNTYFNGAINTIQQGQPVPVGYGELIVGSSVISAGITVE